MIDRLLKPIGFTIRKILAEFWDHQEKLIQLEHHQQRLVQGNPH